MKRALLLVLIAVIFPATGFSLTAKTEQDLADWKARHEQEAKDKKEALDMKLSADQANLTRTLSTTVIADEKEVTAKEPGSGQDLLSDMSSAIPGEKLFWHGEVPGTPVRRFDAWSLKKEDFVVLPPIETDVYVAKSTPLRYFILPYSITNSTGQELILYPRVWLKNDKGRLSQEVGGFIVQEQVNVSLLQNVKSTQEFIATVKETGAGIESVGAFAPGTTRWGVAIFPPLDPEMDEMTVIVEGLSNSYNFTRMFRPALCLDYTRYGDEFDKYADAFIFVGKEWRRQWMWWAETRMGKPEKLDLTGPAGESKHAIWVFDLFLKNSFGTDRTIALSKVAVVLGLTDVAGTAGKPIKVLDGIPITVRLADDGDSTVFKADAFKAASRAVEGKRFLNGNLEKEREISIPIAFEEVDVDWDDVYKQVLEAITPSGAAVYEAVFIKAAEKGQVEKLTTALKKGLDDEIKARIRKEVLEQIPAAMQDAFDSKRFTIELTGDTELAIGTYRIVRDFIRRTEIDKDKLIKNWGH